MKTTNTCSSILLGATVLLLVTGCTDGPVEPGWEERIAPIALGDEEWGFFRDEQIPVPYVDLEASGRTVSVTVATYGTAYCTEESRVEVELDGMRAVVTPYQLAAPRGTDCPRIGASFGQNAVIEFPAFGTATVTVRGVSNYYGLGEELIEVERTIEL